MFIVEEVVERNTDKRMNKNEDVTVRLPGIRVAQYRPRSPKGVRQLTHLHRTRSIRLVLD